MKFLELTFEEPPANLACDEALLETMETGPSSGECLRVWEARKYFVVLGHSNQMLSDVDVVACNECHVPILRRVSGGGTVVQGPGCLNYSLILKNDPRLIGNITDTFQYVLERHRKLIEDLCGIAARVEGISDLTLGGLKVSGNAQYRKARFVLVHGTFLLSFDLRLIEKYLPVPARQPAYRNGRSHSQFITNLNIDPASVRERLRTAWAASDFFHDVPFARIDQLVRDRYGRTEWSEKF
jgi:lipoate-protein ligase A